MGARGLKTYGVLALLAISCLTVPAGAAGLEPGVHVDPGSPAAKEYALPLNQARGTGGGSSPSQNPEASLFGAGIKPPSSGAGGGTSRQAYPRAPESSAPAVVGVDALRALRQPAKDGSGGDGSTLALVAGAVAIVVLGGFGGTVLRHRRPSSAG
jgi:hypothetical protein